jgi:hypothetical protein
VLTSPVDFATNVSVNPKLEWNGFAGALSYHLQVSANPSFVSPIIDDTSITTNPRIIGPLSLATTYYWRVRAKNEFGYGGYSTMRQFTIVTTSVEGTNEQIPSAFLLGQNYPNPFNPSTIIHYELPRAVNVSLKIFNTLGQVVATLVDGNKDAGYHQAQWDATVPGGVYFYRLQARPTDGRPAVGLAGGQAGEYVETKKMMLIK